MHTDTESDIEANRDPLPATFDPSIDPADKIGTRICKEVDASKRRVAHAHGAIAALKDIERRALIAELLWEEEKREFGLRPGSDGDVLAAASIARIAAGTRLTWDNAKKYPPKPKPGLVRRPKPTRPKASKAKQKTPAIVTRGKKLDPTSIAGKVRALIATATKLMTVEDIATKLGITNKAARSALDKMVSKGQATSPRSVQGALKAYRAVK